MADNRHILDPKGRRIALMDGHGNLSREAMTLYLADGLSSEDRAKVDAVADSDPMTREAIDGLLKVPVNHTAAIASLMTDMAERSGADVLPIERPASDIPYLRIAAGVALLAVAVTIGMTVPKWFAGKSEIAENRPVETARTAIPAEEESEDDAASPSIAMDEDAVVMESEEGESPLAETLKETPTQLKSEEKKESSPPATVETKAKKDEPKPEPRPVARTESPEVAAATGTSGEEGMNVAMEKAAPMARSAETARKEVSKPLPYDKVDTPARFPGGDLEMFRFIRLNRNYPEPLRNQGIKGSVLVRFVINADGRMTDISLLEGFHPVLDQDAMRVMRAMPRWASAEHDGNKVAVTRTVAVQYE